MDQIIKLQKMSDEDKKLVKYCKFYMAMILTELLKETPISEICWIFSGD